MQIISGKNVTHPLCLDTNLQPGLNIGMCCVTLRELLLWRDPPYLHLFPFLKLIILKNALIIIIVLDLLPGRLALVRQVSDQKFVRGIIDHMHNTWSPYQSDHLSVQWSRWCIWDTTASSQMEINNIGDLLWLLFLFFLFLHWEGIKWGIMACEGRSYLISKEKGADFDQ